MSSRVQALGKVSPCGPLVFHCGSILWGLVVGITAANITSQVPSRCMQGRMPVLCACCAIMICARWGMLSSVFSSIEFELSQIEEERLALGSQTRAGDEGRRSPLSPSVKKPKLVTETPHSSFSIPPFPNAVCVLGSLVRLRGQRSCDSASEMGPIFRTFHSINPSSATWFSCLHHITHWLMGSSARSLFWDQIYHPVSRNFRLGL